MGLVDEEELRALGRAPPGERSVGLVLEREERRALRGTRAAHMFPKNWAIEFARPD